MPPAAAGLSVYPDLVLPVAVGSACASRRVHRRQLRLDRRPVDQIGNLVQGRSTGFTGKQGFLTNGGGPSRTPVLHASFLHRIRHPKPRQPLPRTGLLTLLADCGACHVKEDR